MEKEKRKKKCVNKTGVLGRQILIDSLSGVCFIHRGFGDSIEGEWPRTLKDKTLGQQNLSRQVTLTDFTGQRQAVGSCQRT